MAGTEFQRIERFVSFFPGAKVPVGIGDDCAVLRPSDKALCVSTDAVVEGVHFSRKHFSFEDIGHKALAVNLSDLAAMGAQPAYFLCAIACPASLPESALAGIARGMAQLARKADVALVGGNFTSSRVLSLTLTVMGLLPPGRALTRRGAKVGEVLYVSGTLGEARWGLSQLGRADGASAAVQRQKRPWPKWKLGLLARDFASSCIDVSDGFSQDLAHVCRASKVGASIALERLPVSAALKKAMGKKAFTYAARGGEDYELILSVPKNRARAFEEAASKAGEKVTAVGEVVKGPLAFFLDGRRVPLPGGFDHFGG